MHHSSVHSWMMRLTFSTPFVERITSNTIKPLDLKKNLKTKNAFWKDGRFGVVVS